MNYSEFNNAFLEMFKKEFPEVAVERKEIDFSGTIHCFFLQFESEKELEANWSRVSNFIAVNYQTRLQTDFEIWNLYLFYQTKAEIEKGLKYKIENDTISSRKIFVEDIDKTADEIVIDHITNSDLQIKINQPKNIAFERNPLIAGEIQGNDQITRKKNKMQFDEVYKTIVKRYRDEIKES